MKPFIICAFYTIKTSYETEIENLKESCKLLSLQTYIRGYDTRGAWVKNCAIKPEFIYEAMVSNPDYNIVYVDADARIQQYPKLFEEMTAEIAVHYKDGKELLSGTIFIQNTQAMREFIKNWIEMQVVRSTVWDQQVLQMCINRYHPVVEDLPPSYTQIFDLMAKHGKPVIEHFQASRRFRTPLTIANIPDIVKSLNPRVSDNGTFFLTHTTPNINKLLEENFIKLPNERRWYPRSKGTLTLKDIKHHFEGKDCYIVGKGPSLDNLSIEDFASNDLPIICVNESIRKVESLDLPNKLFMIQQDAWLTNTCKPSKTGTTLLLGTACQHWYADVTEKYCFHNLDIGLNKQQITAIYAIKIAQHCGATGLKLLCFDAAMSQNTGYAQIVGYSPLAGGDPKRFLNHREGLLKHAEPLLLEFRQIALAESSSDKSVLSSNSHLRHCVDSRSQYDVLPQGI